MRSSTCRSSWYRALFPVLLALVCLAGIGSPGVAASADRSERTTLSFVACDAAAAEVTASRTVVRFVDGRLRRWQELDTLAGTCVVELGSSPRALAPSEAAKLYASGDGSAASRVAQPAAQSVDRAVAGDRRALAARSAELPVSRERSLEDVARRHAAATAAPASVRRSLRRTVASDLSTSERPDRLRSALVFGADDRKRITNTSSFPFRTMVFVLSEFPDGSLLGFSGFLAAPNTVLTAAQALYQEDLGGFATNVEVFPGQTQSGPGGNPTAPFGSQFGAFIEVPQAWVDAENPADNYGAVLLEEPFAGIGEFLPIVFGLVPPANAEMASYDAFAHGETESLALWHRNGATDGFTEDFVFHLLDDDEGAIGAPLWDGVDRVFAIDCCVADDDSANVGVRFTNFNRDLVEEWLAFEGGGGEPLTGPPLVLGNGRFEVRARFRTAEGVEDDAQPQVLTDDTGYFWFFNEENVEIVTKVLNACGLNQRFWVFAGGLTDVAVTLDVVDTLAGERKRYTNQLGTAFQPITDTDAFATCP